MPPIEHKPGQAEREYKDFLVQTLGVASLCLAMLCCFLLTLDMGIAEELAMTQEEVVEISEPASRLLAKAKLPAKTRQIIVSSGDYVGLGVACFAYAMRIITLLSEKRRNGELTQQATILSYPNKRAANTDANPGYIGLDVGALASFGAHTAG